jgi:hypothetical protein
MTHLVKTLGHGEHPVELTLRPERSLKQLRECIDRGYIHVRFPNTQGGTELGVRLNRDASDLNADFDKGTGRIRLVGDLVLDYQKVRCVADVELSSFTGKGHLVLASS